MDGLIQRRTKPKPEPAKEIVKHDRVWGDNPTREQNKLDAEMDARPRDLPYVRDLEKAKANLARLTYVGVIDFLQAMPVGQLELHLLAEEDGLNREEVLRFFPRPGVRARSRWLPDSLAGVDA